MPSAINRASSLSSKSGVLRLYDFKDTMVNQYRHGKPKGKSTGIVELDPHFNWKIGETSCLIGRPGHGKTEIMQFLLYSAAKKHGWKSALWAGENMTVDEKNDNRISPSEIYDNLIQIATGKSVDKRYRNCMSEDEYVKAMDWVHENFFVVYPEDEDNSRENINRIFKSLRLEHGIKIAVKDPWNELDYSMVKREDEFLRHELKEEKKFARVNKLCNLITVHPKGQPTIENGIIKSPTEFDISGGTMWANKMDNILFINRPYKNKDPKDPRIEFGSRKIKKHKIVGTPGAIFGEYNIASSQYSFENNHRMNF